MNIYVGNLPHSATEDELRQAFQSFGVVSTVSIIKDKATGLPRGFAFVEMPTALNAGAAVRGLNGRALSGHALKVSEARPTEERSGVPGKRDGGTPSF